MPKAAKSKAEVFIIESLEFKDEVANRLEGKFLSQILHLGGKKPIYYYIRTIKELKAILEKFKKSRYRYLHLSCHGNSKAIYTTLDAEITFPKLGRIVKEYVEEKRIFISACKTVNSYIARNIIPFSGCYSIIGPVNQVHFHDAAIIWASFYHLMFKADRRRMKRRDISKTLQKVVNTFGISLNYFSTSENEYGYKGDQFIPRKKPVRIFP